MYRIKLNVNMIYKIVLIICCAFVNLSNEQNSPSNPCPNIFQYIYDGSSWYGQMDIPSPVFGQTIKMNIVLSLRARLPTSYVGVLELYNSRDETLQIIMRHEPIRYRIRFPLTYPIPKLTKIMYNDQVICTGQSEVGPVVTEIRLEHILYTEVSNNFVDHNSNNNNNYNNHHQPSYSDNNPINSEQSTENFIVQRPTIRPPVNNKPYRPPNKQPTQSPDITFVDTQQPFYPIHQQQRPQQPEQQIENVRPPQHQQYPQQQQSPHQITQFPQELPPYQNPSQSQLPTETDMPLSSSHAGETNEICGRAHDRFYNTPLIVGGKDIEAGAWPWLVAIYLNKALSLTFHCSGNLISNKLILSAAHCFKQDEIQYAASEVIAFLGRYNIMKWMEEQSVLAELQSIHVHRDYMKKDRSYDADIAILVLKNQVTYSDYIRPICLWSGSNDIALVEGKEGVIIGWGRDGNGNAVTPIPKKISIPIVSERECLRSAPTFNYITSKRTYCAGRRDGKGPCNGDSGGGMSIQQNDRWSLRGIVSASLSDPISNICNLSGFVIFTDAAKFTDWIKTYMNK